MLSVYDDNIFPFLFFSWIQRVFDRELQVLFQILDVTKNVTHCTKHVSEASKVDQGDRVTLPVKLLKGNPLSL